MKVPAQKIISKISRDNTLDVNNESRILWNMLSNVEGYIEVDVHDLIDMYYETQSKLIVEFIEKYASSTEILKFLRSTRDLLGEKTYKMLDEIKTQKMDREIDSAIRKAKDKDLSI